MNMFTKCFIKEGDFVTRCMAGETIIVPMKAHVADLDSIYILNEVSTLIWNLIDGGTHLSQITEAISEEYEVTPEEAAKDIADFLNSLQATGLIRPSVETQG